jgi:predicted acylesterase/phospholipase RssA
MGTMRLTMRRLLWRTGMNDHRQPHDFFTTYGYPSDLRFGDIQNIKLILVAADLKSGRPVLFGEDPDQLVMTGLMASVALPPWFMPLTGDGRYLVDGTIVSSLPIEPALTQGASEIIALDLTDPQGAVSETHGMVPYIGKLLNTMEQRQIDLELKIPAASQVTVKHMALYGESPVAIWDFQRAEALMRRGYEIANREIDQWRPDSVPWWRKWLPAPAADQKKDGQVYHKTS